MGVGREILQALDRAFQLHQNADYQVSQVNTFPRKLLGFDFGLNMFLPTPFHLQRLREISREKSAEMTRMYSQVS